MEQQESEILVIKSLSASGKNYPVRLPDGRNHAKLAPGQTIKGKIFAGKGTDTEIRVKHWLASTFNIPANEFAKASGNGIIIENGKERLVELHWYEAYGEKYDLKVKRYLDES